MMRSVEQVQLKSQLHNELKLRYREFFESSFAIHLLKHPEYFPSVKKISSAIIKMMLSERDIVIDTISKNSRIIAELEQPFFGSCIDSKQPGSAESIYEKMLEILNDNHDLSSIMQIHCIFVYRIHDQIEKRAEKQALSKSLTPFSLFNPANRCRIEKKGEAKTTLELGISNHPVFSKKLELHDKKHLRALDKYEPDHQSPFFKLAIENNIPVVCGPSGHTASLMVGAVLYGELSADELKEYALACFAFLTAGGNHSFHEVFMVAQLLDVAYKTDDYTASIPDAIIAADSAQEIKTQFPQFM